MSGELHVVDIGIILLYSGGLLALGLFNTKRKQDQTDYLLAGRRLTLVPFTASLVATWYGGILGVGEFTYLYGISNWVVLGLPYYIFALLFTLFIAGRIRDENFPPSPIGLVTTTERPPESSERDWWPSSPHRHHTS